MQRYATSLHWRACLLSAFACAIVVSLPQPLPAADDWDEIPFDRAMFKAAHNSIDRGVSLTRQLDWDADQRHVGGCVGIELDIVADPARLGTDDTWQFAVQHGGDYDAANPKLREALTEVREWADSHQDHRVILVHIDLKNGACRGDVDDFCQQIDRILASVGRDRIFRPADLKRDAETLLAGAQRYGWPTLGELRGHVLFCFSGGDGDPLVGTHKHTYATKDDERLAFVDLDQRFPEDEPVDGSYLEHPYYQQGSRVFINLERGRPGWQLLGKRAAEEGGFVTRVWKLNTLESWRDGIRAQINVLSTDHVDDADWATVGRSLFRPQRRPQ